MKGKKVSHCINQHCHRAFLGLLTDTLPKICHIYPIMMKFGRSIPYLKKIQKLYESSDTSFDFCWHQHFCTKNQQILLYQEIQIKIVFWFIIPHSFNFLWVFKDLILLKNMVTILIISAKMATIGLLEIKVFWNKCYDVIIFLHGVINKILSCDSNYL